MSCPFQHVSSRVFILQTHPSLPKLNILTATEAVFCSSKGTGGLEGDASQKSPGHFLSLPSSPDMSKGPSPSTHTQVLEPLQKGLSPLGIGTLTRHSSLATSQCFLSQARGGH